MRATKWAWRGCRFGTRGRVFSTHRIREIPMSVSIQAARGAAEAGLAPADVLAHQIAGLMEGAPVDRAVAALGLAAAAVIAASAPAGDWFRHQESLRTLVHYRLLSVEAESLRTHA